MSFVVCTAKGLGLLIAVIIGGAIINLLLFSIGAVLPEKPVAWLVDLIFYDIPLYAKYCIQGLFWIFYGFLSFGFMMGLAKVGGWR